MDNNLFNKNINALKIKNPELAKKIIDSDYCNDYADEFPISKTGLSVPLFNNGKALYSKYNPERDVERLFNGSEEFILFCGLGSGLQISYFLEKNPDKHCAVIDSKTSNLKTLFSKFDYTQIISNERFYFLSPLSENIFENEFLQTYMPIMHGNFALKILRAWEDFYKEEIPILEKLIQEAVKKIQSDLSTQSRFGKIWMRNIFFNLQMASKINPVLPKCDTNKTAYILGAGPSLEDALNEIKKRRDDFVLFATDTSFSVLNSAKIEADFFISIDPQIVSYAHCLKEFSKNCVGIFDLCANPITIRRFKDNGNPFFYVAGAHPLAQLASSFSPLPPLMSGGGTVAITAMFAAIALGYKDLEYAGLDFAYTAGKAYSRETYLSEIFLKSSSKLSPMETKFTDLMFRSPVTKNMKNGKLDYTTDLLDFYREFFDAYRDEHGVGTNSQAIWQAEQFKSFPYKEFLESLNRLAKEDEKLLNMAFLPYFAYKSKENNKNTKDFFDLELVLSQISRYTIE